MTRSLTDTPPRFASTVTDPPTRLSILGTHVTPSIMISMEEMREKKIRFFKEMEEKLKNVIGAVIKYSDMTSKYDLSGKEPLLYAYTRQPSKYVFLVEAFPHVRLPLPPSKLMEELVYHKMFEEVIFRYTNEQRKPNPVLIETRSSDFCYQLVIKFEAVPVEVAKHPDSHELLHEFQVLQHIWENYRKELVARQCPPDQLIGFPMPFEFRNVVGSPLYDFPRMTIQEFYYFNLNGKPEKIDQSPVSPFGFGTDSKNVVSSLNYMSVEKLGPNLPHLMDLMQSQFRRLQLSSALKVYDQLISRLMVLHKYGIAHCDINPKSLSFGCKETTNVLYINSFDKAVLCNSNSKTIPLFHDRFVSHLQMKDRTNFYLFDLESAFYIFLYLLVDRLPWDSKLSHETSETDLSRMRVVDANTSKTRTLESKEKFWTSNDSFRVITKSISYEFSDPLYCNFSLDLLETLYSKMKEAINTCQMMSSENFFKQIYISGSAPNSCYVGIRRVIASYFRFESVKNITMDVTCTTKLDMLVKGGAADKRLPWNLTYWCWNQLDADPERRRRSERQINAF